MRLVSSSELTVLGGYLPRFVDLVGEDRWFKRVGHLDSEQRLSPFRWKIVKDYHWLEMAISFQFDVLAREGRLRLELTDAPILAALNFAASTVEVHTRLSNVGQRRLEGRLRDCLKAETGYASLYLEIDLAQRLMDAGFDVTFADMETTAQYDLAFSRDKFVGEVECKSLSADAGRQIHRKDFDRFMEALSSALESQRARLQPEVLLITLDGRLSSNILDQASLRAATRTVIEDSMQATFSGDGFELERQALDALHMGAWVADTKAFYSACSATFGPNAHIAGGLTEDSGCLIVMRSKREDDISKPMLEGMREASDQFSGQRPAFIAMQLHGIEATDLMLPHLRRRAGILAYALYGHYGSSHVNATYFTGFGAVSESDGIVGTPALAIPNPKPAFKVEPADASPFLAHISDGAFAAAIGAPVPAPNISSLPIDQELDERNC